MHGTRPPASAAAAHSYGDRGELPPDDPGEHGDEARIRVRHLDPFEPHAELARLLLRLGVDVPADLEMVGDEADRADEHVLDAARSQLAEVVEDVRSEPRLARRRLALKRKRPYVFFRVGCDEPRGLEQLVAVRIAVGEDAGWQRMRREDDVRVAVADPVGEQPDEAGLVVPALDEGEPRAPGPRALQLV